MNRVATLSAMAVLVVLPLLAGFGDAPPPDAPRTVVQGAEIAAPHSPQVARVGDRSLLVYEVHLTSFARNPLQLLQVEVISEPGGQVLQALAGSDLVQALGVVGGPPDSRERSRLDAGLRTIVYLSVPVAEASPPTVLSHRVRFRTADGAEAVASGGRVGVDPRRSTTLAPPLRGGPWVAVYDPAMERGHRRVVYATQGRAVIPGRHAIDWMTPRASPEGMPANPWQHTNGFGAEVLAVADAKVVAVRDDLKEPEAGAERPRTGLADAPGNAVTLLLPDGRYAHYEHLAPGVLVKPGDRVRQGQVIGRMGSTGQASRPHLHFHVSDASSALDAEGQPYPLRGWRPVGRYSSIDSFHKGDAWAQTPATSSSDDASLPLPNSVVVFD